jgi:hypothetical protein
MSISRFAVRHRIVMVVPATRNPNERTLVQYMILIYSDPAEMQQQSESEQRQMVGEYMAYSESLRQSGVYQSGQGLEPASTATTVRVRDGKQLISDGPFAETREVLGGFYLIECESLDDALTHAAACPGARHGSVEVRPVMQIPART